VTASLPGGTPSRAVPAGGGLWLILCELPADRYSADRIDARLRDLDWLSACALAHESVVQRFVNRPALAPMKLFTMFASETRALALVRRRRRRFDRILDRVAGCREWGVRVVPGAVRPRSRPQTPATSGVEFLQRKQRALEAKVASAGRGRQLADRVHRRLRSLARAAARQEATPRVAGLAAPVLDAAYLTAGTGAAFRAAVRHLDRTARAQGYRVMLTGPWPPYHFVGASRVSWSGRGAGMKR